MKKILKCILLLFMFTCFIKVNAYELTYSEWSQDYPNGIDSNLIESEKRYLWYKDTISNIEYLIKEKINDKSVDYDDFKITEESEESLIEPEHYVDRIINKKVKNTKYTENDVSALTINNTSFKDKVLLSEIEVINNLNQEKLKLNVDTKLSLLIDGTYDEYMEFNDSINIKFDSKQNVNNLLVKLYYKCSCENDNTFTFNYLSEDEYAIYNNAFKVENCIMEIKPNELKPNLIKSQTFYTYIDKLYKTYDVKREITSEYYKDYSDKSYTRLDSSEKTFYRYITNEELVFDCNGNIVTDPEKYCVKQYCIVKKYKNVVLPPDKEVPKKTNNPKTLDNIYYYFISFIVSVLAILLLIIVNRKKITKIFSKKLNNKSSFVESI